MIFNKLSPVIMKDIDLVGFFFLIASVQLTRTITAAIIVFSFYVFIIYLLSCILSLLSPTGSLVRKFPF